MRYPYVNEEFELKYIPGLEQHYIILNEGNSEFAQNIAREKWYTQRELLRQAIVAAQVKCDLDPFNPAAMDELQKRQQALDEFERSCA